MRCLKKFFSRVWSNKEKKKGRNDDAEQNVQQVIDCLTKLDENFLGTKCFPSNKEDSQFRDNYSKRKKFIEFCRNAFYKFCCCCMSGEISDSRNCVLENNLAHSQIRLDSSKYDENILKDNYEFNEIGNGNFGTVYLARSKNSDEKLALKVVNMKRFCLAQRRVIKREKTAWTSTSSHPHIVTLISYFKTNTSFCFVSDYVDGQDLTKYIQYNKFLEEAEAKILAAQVASAITFIHNKGDFLNLFIYLQMQTV
ncbi:serine/threonine-protein kinase Sgk1-like [Centruroides vittatus]|uniref:serine/threonine-protein kinase Sgk1-like n=1 Tax=Centruroides vittatus TaxID=120091 RepID=UPI00351059D5